MKRAMIGMVLMGSICRGDDASLKSYNEQRDAQIAEIQVKLGDPATTDKEKSGMADMELSLIDKDTKVLKASTDLEATQSAMIKEQAAMISALQDKISYFESHGAATAAPSSGSTSDVISVSQPTFHVTGQSDSYIDFGWKVTVNNGTDHATKDSIITISCRDKEDIEVAKISSDLASLPQGTTVVTESSSMKIDLWKMVDHYVVTVQE